MLIFCRYDSIRPESARIRQVWRESACMGAELARVGADLNCISGSREIHVARPGTDERSAASLPRRRVPPRRTRVRWVRSRVRASQDCIEATVQILYFNKKMYSTIPPRFEIGLPDSETNVHKTEIANEQTKQMESYT